MFQFHDKYFIFKENSSIKCTFGEWFLLYQLLPIFPYTFISYSKSFSTATGERYCSFISTNNSSQSPKAIVYFNKYSAAFKGLFNSIYIFVIYLNNSNIGLICWNIYGKKWSPTQLTLGSSQFGALLRGTPILS